MKVPGPESGMLDFGLEMSMVSPLGKENEELLAAAMLDAPDEIPIAEDAAVDEPVKAEEAGSADEVALLEVKAALDDRDRNDELDAAVSMLDEDCAVELASLEMVAL